MDQRFIPLGCVRLDAECELLIAPDGRPVRLRAQSWALLKLMVERAGHIVRKDEMFERVWAGKAVTNDSVVQCICEIRRAIGDVDQSVLVTEPSRGYRLLLSPFER